MAEETLTAAEKEQLSELMGYGSNIQDGKHTVHSFLNNVSYPPLTLFLKGDINLLYLMISVEKQHIRVLYIIIKDWKR